ncbi:IS1595 family transposase [Flavobacterium litorale]|uniref:IS1595 family transposase n=1 Tax=Flavobacterium litorale TaxID=2856519 RepID=A0ABX8V4J9_9FLAO|nr:IS1595 family transposase [Flavobacterium litorale]QYJ67677.1 IS1595 family transposase [Flavobacterium litorale]
MKFFKSLLQLIDTLRTDEDCRTFLENAIWGDSPICPHCGLIDDRHYKLKFGGTFTGTYKCRSCKIRFNIRTGTMFEGSHIPLRKWFLAIYLFLSHKKGISSIQLHKDIGVTQKTAWFMLHRIRCNCEDKIEVNFDTETQIDETYVGGKARGKRAQGRSLIKTPVMGLLSNGKVKTIVIPNASAWTLKTVIYHLVKFGSTIVTDGWKGYQGLHKSYNHKVIRHNQGIYVEDGYHTNSIEGFWSHLKRGIIGVYHLVSRKHLHKYCEEFTYRYNTREMSDGERFTKFVSESNNKITYRQIIGM